MGAKHAKWFVTSAKTTGWLRETELVPHTQGIVETIKQTRFALALARVGKVPPPFPPHVAKDVREARLLYDLVQQQGRSGYEGSCRASPHSRSSRTATAKASGIRTERARSRGRSSRARRPNLVTLWKTRPLS